MANVSPVADADETVKTEDIFLSNSQNKRQAPEQNKVMD